MPGGLEYDGVDRITKMGRTTPARKARMKS